MDEKTKLIIQILQLAYLIQKYTNFAVFISFSGHVDSLEIVREK